MKQGPAEGFDIDGQLLHEHGHFNMNDCALVLNCNCNSINTWLTLDEEIIFEHTNSTAEDEEFDASVRYLEELLLDEQFQSMLESFYESNCGIICSLTYTLLFLRWSEITVDVNFVIIQADLKRPRKINSSILIYITSIQTL